MTIPPITCDQFAETLADYLEPGANERTRAVVETHAAGCAACGALLNDLRQLRVDSAALPPLTPEHDLWAGIAARIETPIVEITSSGRLDSWSHRRDRGMRRVWMGLAAAGLVAVTATVTHQVTKRSVAVTPTNVAVVPAPKAAITPAVTPAPIDSSSIGGGAATPAALASNRTPADKAYDAEIARLRAVVAQRRSMLDTTTINIIEHNLKIIDGAIAQCREALMKDPASRFLMQSLNDALDTKVQLLRTAASLPSRA